MPTITQRMIYEYKDDPNCKLLKIWILMVSLGPDNRFWAKKVKAYIMFMHLV